LRHCFRNRQHGKHAPTSNSSIISPTNNLFQPPKRTRPSRAAAQPTTLPSPSPAKRAKRTPAAKPATRKSSRVSTTKPNAQNLAQNDNEIREAFHLFSHSRDGVSDPDEVSDDEGGDGDDDEGVIKISDVRRALNACNLPKPPADFFDEDQKYLSWRHFLDLGRTLREMAGADDDEDEDEDVEVDEEEEEEGGAKDEYEDGGGGGFVAEPDKGEEADARDDIEDEDEEEAGGFTKPTAPASRARKPKATTTDTTTAKPKASRKRKSAAVRSHEEEQEELSHAFSLFTHSTTRTHITLQDLRRVAKELREEVDDKILMLMIEEANEEEGRQSVGKGVGKEEFEGVMRRAGVF